MSTTTESTRHTLSQRELMALEHPHGFALECVSGELWITADGLAGDMVLFAGQRLRLENTPKVVISALRPSVLLAAPCCGEAPIRRIAARCAALLADRIERWRYPALASYTVTRLI